MRSEYWIENVYMNSYNSLRNKLKNSTQPALPAEVALLLHPLSKQFIFQN